MKKILLPVFVMFFMSLSLADSFGWGRTGHDAVAAIAERHLTGKARATVEAILDGKSIVYWSNWMDNVRRTPEYGYTTSWHVSHVDSGFKAVIAEKHGKYNGDCLWGLEKIMPVLEDYKAYDDSTVQVNLKFLIHLIGDMHCPVHVYYEDKQDFNVVLGSRKTSYHALWDSGLINSVHNWSYSEYADMLDRADRKEIARICRGSLVDWVEECARDCRVIYDWAGPDQVIDQDFKNRAVILAERQIEIAGYRLAYILNSLFD